MSKPTKGQGPKGTPAQPVELDPETVSDLEPATGGGAIRGGGSIRTYGMMPCR